VSTTGGHPRVIDRSSKGAGARPGLAGERGAPGGALSTSTPLRRDGLVVGGGGVALWYALGKRAGVHTTIAGRMPGVAIPAQRPGRAGHPARAPRARLAARSRPPEEDMEAAEVRASRSQLEDVEAPLTDFPSTLLQTMVEVGCCRCSRGELRVRLGPGAAGSPAESGWWARRWPVPGPSSSESSSHLRGCDAAPGAMPGGAPRDKLYGVAIVGGGGFTVALFVAAASVRGEGSCWT